MKARHLTGFLHGLLEPRTRQPSAFRVEGPDLAGRAFRGDGGPELTIVAHSSRSSIAAERLRLALIDGAGRLQTDTWQVSSPVVLLATPSGLEDQFATFLAWATRAGGQERNWVAGYLRRGRVTWELLMSDAAGEPPVDLLAGVALDLVNRDLPVADPSLWHLLPVASDLPVPMWLDGTLGADPQGYDLVAA